MGETDLVENNLEFKFGYVRFRQTIRYGSQVQEKDSGQIQNLGSLQYKDGN